MTVAIDASKGWYGTSHSAVSGGAAIAEHGDGAGVLVVSSSIPLKIQVWQESRLTNVLTVWTGGGETATIRLPDEPWQARVTNQYGTAADIYTAYIP